MPVTILTKRSQFCDSDFLETVEEVFNLLYSKFGPRDQVKISFHLRRGVMLGAVSRNINGLEVHVRLVAYKDSGFSVISEQAG